MTNKRDQGFVKDLEAASSIHCSGQNRKGELVAMRYLTSEELMVQLYRAYQIFEEIMEDDSRRKVNEFMCCDRNSPVRKDRGGI